MNQATQVGADRSHHRAGHGSSRARDLRAGARTGAGVWAPRGKGRPVDGGVVVSGRWAYCSGIVHAGVFFAGCIVESGPPSVIAMPHDELEILDTWHTLGLRGTGSHDVVADELFVP